MDSVLPYLAVFVVFVATAYGYSQGPPSDTCLTQFPKHGVEQQTDNAPYKLTLSPATYTPGQNITVAVEATSSVGFKGFQVTAHRVASSGNAEEFIGTFIPDDDTVGQAISCVGQPKKMWAHKSGSVKTRVVATWTAPEHNLGDLQFLLSVVEEKLKFWSKIPTPLQAQTSQNVVPPTHTVPSVTLPNQPINWRTCGQTKGCWMVPMKDQSSCNGNDCQAALSFEKQGDNFIMELAVKGQDHYVSVGFSEDTKMGGDQTVTCTATSGHESVQLGYNPAYYNSRELTDGIFDFKVGQADGQAFCAFTRKAALSTLEENKVFNLSSTPYYLFLAWGHIYDGTDVFGQHDDAPAITAKKISLTVDPAQMSAIATASTDPTSAATLSHTTISHLIGSLLVCVMLIM